MRMALIVIAAAACGGNDTPMAGTASVLELHAGSTRAGAYVAPTFTHAAAAGLHLDTSFVANYPGGAFAQALYVDRGGARDLVIAASEMNVVSAFDPTGAVVWQVTLGDPQIMPNPAEGANCGDISPLGITGTPVIDAAGDTIYFDAMIHDNGTAHHRIYGLALADGSTRAGWPVDVGTALASAAIPFMPAPQNQRGGLTLHDGSVYVPYGGHAGDCGNYHGWVVAVPTAQPSNVTAFATTSAFAGAWTPGGVTSDGTSVFVVFGNGEGGATWQNSDAVIRLGDGASFSDATKDYWAPTNWASLDATDLDITGPAMPLDLPGATPSALVVSFGKDGMVYLNSRDDLGGIADALASLQAASSAIINTPAIYHTALGTYVVVRAHGAAACPGLTGTSSVVAVRISPGAPPTLSLAWCAGTAQSGSPIATTTDGSNNAIVWAIGAESDQRLHGYDGDTGEVVFDGGGAGDAMSATSRFITPIVAKGRIFVAADGQLYAFTL